VTPPVPGSFAKVWLPGETPWAECVKVNEDGTWLGRIANHLFAEMTDAQRDAVLAPTFGSSGGAQLPRLHSYKQDHLVLWKPQDDGEFTLWVPAEDVGRA
jgi:hypothetical protein